MHASLFSSTTTKWVLEVRHPQEGWLTVTTAFHVLFQQKTPLRSSIWEFINAVLRAQLTDKQFLFPQTVRREDERARSFFGFDEINRCINPTPVKFLFGTDQDDTYRLDTTQRHNTQKFLANIARYQCENGHMPLLEPGKSFKQAAFPKDKLFIAKHSAHEVLQRHAVLAECGGLRPDNVRLLCRINIDTHYLL